MSGDNILLDSNFGSDFDDDDEIIEILDDP